MDRAALVGEDAGVDSEQSILTALKARDPHALAAVFEQYSDKLYRLAVSLLHDEQQADGVVQNAFLKLIEHIDRFEGRASIGTWLYRVAYNDALMRTRRAKPQVDLDAFDDAEMMPACLVNWNDVPDTMLSSREAQQVMDAAIASLSPLLRAVFTLRDVEELSTQATADILGISEAAVKVRLHRARLALREKLASYFDERIQRR